jgi:hypothetical protein
MASSILRVCTLLSLLALAPAGTGHAQAFPGSAPERLAALDADGDGLLSRYEYDSDAALAAMDRDHNDRITPAELQEFLGRVEDGAESASYRVSVVDSNGDGELTDAELRRGLDIRFTWLDSNKDGNVDLPELEAGFGVPLVR